MTDNNRTAWIGASDDGARGDISRVICFRKILELTEHPGSFPVDITADAKYKLYVNGALVNVGPQKGDRQVRYLDRLDIGEYLRRGRNSIVALVMAIPDRPRGGMESFARTGTPGLYLRGGSRLGTDGSWKWKTAPVSFKPETEDERFAHLYHLEEAAGSEFNGPLFDAEFDDCSWEYGKPYDPLDLPDPLRPENLLDRTIPLMGMEAGNFTGLQCLRRSGATAEAWENLLRRGEALTIPAGSREIVEISAGEETTAYLRLLLKGGSGARIDILTSESYAYEPIEGLGGPVIPRKGDRTDWKGGRLYGFTDSYRVGGAGMEDSPEIYEPYWFRTFRYIGLTVETGEAPLTLLGFSFVKTGYPLRIISRLNTSDATLGPIWDISERSLRLCMHETYEDCPFYEQLQYAMDTRSQILYTYAASADDRLARQAMDDFRRSVRYDGMIGCSYPHYENRVIPGFGIFYIAMVYDHMMYFGDRHLIGEHLPAVLGVLNFYRNHLDESGLVGKMGGPLFSAPFWSFIDWTDQWRDTLGVPPATRNGPLTMESFYFIHALDQASALAAFLGYGDLSGSLREEADRVRAAVNRLCLGREGLYRDGPDSEEYSQHCQVFAVLTDTVDRETGGKNLRETLQNRDKYAQCSVAMTFYLFRALEKCGLYDLTGGLWDIWRDMVKKNLTTCEEDSVLSRSDCHAWGALALYEYPSSLLGLRPTAPGFAAAEIRPLAGYLPWAEGTAATPKGPVHISWRREEGGLRINYEGPEGIHITLG